MKTDTRKMRSFFRWMTDRGGGWQRDTPTIFTSTPSICSVDTYRQQYNCSSTTWGQRQHWKPKLSLNYIHMVVRAILQVSIWYQKTQELKNYIQHWELLELILVIAVCTTLFYIFFILKLEYSIGDRQGQKEYEPRVCLLAGSVKEPKYRPTKNMRSL